MAIVGALTSGNWSSSLVFATPPASGDTVVANGKTVTIDQDITVGTIQTLAAGAFASGGSFQLSSNRTINANCLAGTTGCLAISGSATVTVNGNATGGSTSNDYGIDFASSGTLTLNGNCVGGTNTSSAYGMSVNTGTVNITGNVTSGTNNGAEGVIVNGGVVTLAGNITAGTSDSGVTVNSGTFTWSSGNGTMSSVTPALKVNGGTATVQINIVNSTSTVMSLVEVAGTLICNGTITATTGFYPPIIMSSTSAGVTCNGTVTAGDDVAAVQVVIGPATITVNGNFVCSANGTFPFNGDHVLESFRLIISSSASLTHTYLKTGGGTRDLTTGGGASGILVNPGMSGGFARTQ